MKELYQLGETPPLGEVPPRMLAQVVRQDRFGEPTRAFKVEQVEVPSELRPDEVLVWVMAAGINYKPQPLPHRRERRLRHRVEGGERGA